MYQEIIQKTKHESKLDLKLIGFAIYIKSPIKKHIMDVWNGYPNFKKIRIRIIIRIRIRI